MTGDNPEVQQELSGVEYDRIGHYEILHKVSEGGFGIVYNALDTRLRREVAIKVLHPYHASDPTRVARFLREARSAAKLQHPGIVQVHEVVEADGRMALVMEFIRGKTLDDYLRDHPDLPLSQVLEIAAKIADTLDAAHRASVIHRDVKPANVMIDEYGNVKLTDFSLARLLDSSLTQLTGDNNVIGTPAYMSPEQCQGNNAVPQSDLYSLGVMVYEMATGSQPFEAENYLALLRLHTDTPPTPVRLIKPDLPVALEQLIMRCLAKEPEKRPASGAELARELRCIAHEELAKEETAHGFAGGQQDSEGQAGHQQPTPQPAAYQHTPPPQPAPPQHTPQPAAYQHTPPPQPVPPQHTPQPGAYEHTPPPQPAPPQHTPQPGGYQHTPPPQSAPPQHTPQPDGYSYTPQPDALPQQPSPQPGELSAPSAGQGPGETAQQVRRRRTVRVVQLGAAICLVVFGAILAWTFMRDEKLSVPALLKNSPLAEYVNQPDSQYSYGLHSELRGEGYTAHVLDMTSQSWHPEDVMPPKWRHWLVLVVPDKVSQNKALLVMSEGLTNGGAAPEKVPATLADLATTTNSIVGILDGFPRDPLGVYDEDGQVVEKTPEEFATASFVQFLETGDPTWPVVCPLVKSVVKAMDTVQEYVKTKLELETPVEQFVLTGAGNGWGVWLTGAVDDRVAGIAPVKFGLVNIYEQIDHQVLFRGELSPFLALVSETGVMPALETPEGEELLSIIDPYSYADALTMPKLLLQPAGNDPYVTVDAPKLYFDKLQGGKYLFCVPNIVPRATSPLVEGEDSGRVAPAVQEQSPLMVMPPTPEKARTGAEQMRDTLRVFYHKLLVDKPMPEFTWDIQPDGTYRLDTVDKSVEVRLWTVDSEYRDFRYETIGTTWAMEKVKPSEDEVFMGAVKPAEGKYRAFCLELIYPSKLGVNFSLTTPVTILEPGEPSDAFAGRRASMLLAYR